MPRNNSGKARKIIKAFCQRHDVPYYETGTFKSYREVLSYLHQVGAPFRRWSRLEKQLGRSCEGVATAIRVVRISSARQGHWNGDQE
jgi:hypothetical protein